MSETTVPTEEQVLARIREELAAIKVPGAETAELSQIHDEELKPIKGVGDAVALTIRLAGAQQA
jgi:hypothetical protein